MRKTMRALLALCALAAAGRAADPEPPAGAKAELKKLKGSWTVTRAYLGKREVRAPIGMTYTFDGARVTMQHPFGGPKGTKETFKVKLDTSKKPYRLTMTPEGGGRAMTCLIKLEKGELSLASGPRAEAPADFKAGEVRLFVMTKPKK